MKRVWISALVMACIPISAMASGDGPDKTLWVYLVDFLILAIPAFIILRPIVKKSLAAKNEAVQAKITAAEEAFASAEARVKQAEERIAALTSEIEAIMAEFAELGRLKREAPGKRRECLGRKSAQGHGIQNSQALKMARSELATELINQTFAQVESTIKAQGNVPVSTGVVKTIVEEVRQEEA